ncbi:MAG: SIMPL domain-containing protein [Thermomicrobiales bacterium]
MSRLFRPVALPRAIVALAVLAMVGAAFAGLSRPAAAQDAIATPTTAASGTTTVSVNGQGRVFVEPDTASVVVGVDVIQDTLAAAQTEATTQMTAIIAALTGAGIAEDDIQTVNFSVSILRDYDERGMPGPINGFQVSHQVNVTVRDVEQLGDLLDTVVDQGANAIWGISFYVEDPSGPASEARKLAVENATRKAQELAEASGMQLGRLVSISEGYAPAPLPVEYAAAEMDQRGGGPPVQAGTTEIAVEVQLTFELVP